MCRNHKHGVLFTNMQVASILAGPGKWGYSCTLSVGFCKVFSVLCEGGRSSGRSSRRRRSRSRSRSRSRTRTSKQEWHEEKNAAASHRAKHVDDFPLQSPFSSGALGQERTIEVVWGYGGESIGVSVSECYVVHRECLDMPYAWSFTVPQRFRWLSTELLLFLAHLLRSHLLAQSMEDVRASVLLAL